MIKQPLVKRAFQAMTVATKTKNDFTTRVLPAKSVHLAFSSKLEQDGFVATGSDTEWIKESRAQLRMNNCVGIPTETVYGLAANALDEDAVHSIYRAKSRPSDNPLIVHVSSIHMLRALYHVPAGGDARRPFLGTDNAESEGLQVDADIQRKMQQAEQQDIDAGGSGVWPEIPGVYHEVIRRFWPGPLTIVLPRPACIPMAVLGGHGDTVAFRFPVHPVARAVISSCGLPLAAPSANASGRPSPTSAAHVLHDLKGRLPLIVDGGDCDVGVESTVLDAYSGNAYVDGQLSPCILRPGGVTFEQLCALGGVWTRTRVYKKDFVNKDLELNPTTPGMKYRHYAPSAPVHLLLPLAADTRGADAMQSRIDGLAEDIGRSGGGRLGVVAVRASSGSETTFSEPPGCQLVVHWVDDAKHLAHSIFALLRSLDEVEHVDAILVEGVEEADEGMAVMNRLTKAATSPTA
ncbi:hypothetical protein LPJ75_005218 [Coemansia sp. RSA 2598]|nr:hypothetical protein LPJ75_005218 [Coemansia sp. RSA 2598]